MNTQFFWLRSTIAENRTPQVQWGRQLLIANASEDIASEGAAIVVEIAGEADAERASDLLERTPGSMPVWIYDPSASVGSSVAWIKAGAANVFTDVAELGSAMDSVHVARVSYRNRRTRSGSALPA